MATKISKFVLRLPTADHKKVKRRAAQTGISMNELIVIILKEYEKRPITLDP